MKVECAESCGNAPRKHLLRDFIVDGWRDKGSAIDDYLADGVLWNIVGGERYSGVDAIREWLQGDGSAEPVALLIHNIITHGNTAAVNVTVTMRDDSRIECCDVFRFAGFGPKAKIREITTYRIRVESP